MVKRMLEYLYEMSGEEGGEGQWASGVQHPHLGGREMHTRKFPGCLRKRRQLNPKSVFAQERKTTTSATRIEAAGRSLEGSIRVI